MTRGVPMLDPERDLKGATPVKLARALFRNHNPALRPGFAGKSVTGDQVAVKQPPTSKTGDRVPHLVKRV